MTTPIPHDLGYDLPADVPFTRLEALAQGVDDETLGHLTRTRVLRRPAQGVYVASAVADTLRQRLAVLRRVVPDGAFVCDRTAAWLHVGDRALAPNEDLAPPPVSCFRPTDTGRLRRELTASGEREILPRDLMELDGLRVTTPLRTALDLGRLQPHRDLRLGGMDAMLSMGTFDRLELMEELGRFRRRRGVVGLRETVLIADGGAASMSESALRWRWYDAGLPRPTTQIPIEVDGVVAYYLDMGLEEERFAAEYDGERWHSSPEDIAYDLERRTFLRSERGWVIEEFVGTNVYGRKQDADRRLRIAYEAARKRRR